MKHKNIPKGYKDSPLGIIPKEWEVKKLGEICDKITDGTHGTPQKQNSGKPFLTAIHIKDGWIDYDNCYYLTEKDHAEIYKRCNPQFGDILMVNIGAGVCSVAMNRVNYEFSLKNVALLKPNLHFCTGKYLEYILLYRKKIIISSLLNGGAQPFLGLEDISKIKIIVPPIKEQKKIAELLNTWDEAIEKQTKLIDILSRRKRGLMQQLLTKKKRLPNFTKKWEKVKLGEISTIKKGKALTESEIADGIYPVIAGGKTSPYNHYNFTDENVVTISASGAYAGFVSYHNYKIWASDCSVIKSINKVSNIHYLYQLLSFHQNYIYTLQSGGAQPHIFPKDISKLSFYIPTVDEQEIIAKILSNNDHLISLARQCLDVMLIQKRGLMQQLLTGKKRIKT
ncbi:restriction endonuclease subunit S [Bacteroides thetaiotaomicron]|jgi:type I restriction-modification enzyme S subunit|uniref:restriction endonuclease subunit S n=1 Tax=Bacteroides thetaiotaomicron TaxID=818 RepID=UPI001F2B084B|nr:restriction endonuclease subunit S [Bacteroides thetaiotaomicron]MCE8479677.1 restriction endonuclease subunit S [Bacteroides thetaiotaomicron]UVV85737.1 restriction endonuclease subunit S [Bacteroides thetaiotaomicron]